MVRRHHVRALRRLTVVLIAAILSVGVAHGALAAPAVQPEAVVEEITRQVAQIRGLAPKSDTPVVTVPRPGLVSRLSSDLNSDQTVREFLTSQMLLEVMGAMEQGFDLRALQLRLVEEQTIALYDYQERSIYLVADATAGAATNANTRLVMAHEVTHALQDQHFNLRRVIPAKPESSDADAAARALVEGDAMLTMRIWGRQFLRPTEKRSLGDEPVTNDPVLDGAPPLVRGELLFPYDAGWVFAQLLHQDGGYAAVDRAFQNPPRSTEQILHPEKYAAGEAPVTVKIEPLEQGLNGTWKTLRTDVFGELVLRLLLEPNVGWPTAESAAAGWGGDAYTILEDGDGRRIVAVVTAWDTEADASEMYNAFVQSIAVQYPSAQRTVVQSAVARWTLPGYQVQALSTENVVRLVYAPDAATLDRVETLISGATIGPRGPVAPRPAATPTAGPPPGTTVPPPSVPTPSPDSIDPTDSDEPSTGPAATPDARPGQNGSPAPSFQPPPPDGAPAQNGGPAQGNPGQSLPPAQPMQPSGSSAGPREAPGEPERQAPSDAPEDEESP